MKAFEKIAASVPPSWEAKQIGEICEVVRGGSPRPKGDPRYFGGDIPWITIADVNREPSPFLLKTKEGVTVEGSKKSRLIRAGELILSNSATICVPKILGVDGCIHDGFLTFIGLSERVNLKYAYHYFRYIAPFVRQEFKQGVTQVNLNTNEVKKFIIPIPLLSEQKRIAEILDRAEALRSQRRASLALLDELTQSIFLDMFGDPVTNPLNWPKASVGEICSRITVGIVVKPASYYQPSGVPALRSLNIRANRINRDDFVFVSERDNNSVLKKTRLKSGDIALVRSGQPGTAAVIPPDLDGVNAIDILIASPNTDRVNRQYLCSFFNSTGGKQMVLSHQRGQIQKHLNVKSLKEAEIPLPCIIRQNEFESRLATVNVVKEKIRKSASELDVLFASLQQRAFLGEL